MKLPVDDTTLTSWAALLGLSEEQTTDVLHEIEKTLRTWYDRRPTAQHHLTFEEATADTDPDELARMFLTSGLRATGDHDTACAVEVRLIFFHHQAMSHTD
ncbi:hypothetical protein OHU45_25910 [Streptomyces tubercidicus]|uniref:hypothetical protein n=1 Tax=Streptomyces tubercidicus TaxID=47759 RepID=UPI0032458524